MAAGDARFNPIKATAYRVTFPILDADGDLVTGATGLDSEVSKDGVTFADCTNEAVEIATNSGMYYLDLTSTEMDADTVVVTVKTSSSGAKTTPLVFYPLKAADLPVNVVQISGDSAAADNLEAAADGTGYNLGGGSVVAASVTGAVGSVTGNVGGSVASVTGNVGGNVVGSVGSVTAAVTVGTNNDKTGYSLATEPPTAGAIADVVWDEAYNQHTTAGTFGKLMDTLRKANYVTEGSVAAGGTPTTTSFRTDLTEPDGTFDHQTLLFLTGVLAGESVPILTYEQTNGLITTQDALTAAPTAADEFVILPDHVHDTGEIADAVLTTQMIESYRATNAAPTLAQAAFELIAHMGEASISSTTKTLKKLDGSTTAKTYTLDSSTTPTSITEAT